MNCPTERERKPMSFWTGFMRAVERRTLDEVAAGKFEIADAAETMRTARRWARLGGYDERAD